MRRFLVHVLPRGFVKVRHYGLLANRQRQRKLACCRLLLAAVAAVLLLGQVGAALRPGDSGCQRCGSAALRRREISQAVEVGSAGARVPVGIDVSRAWLLPAPTSAAGRYLGDGV